MGEAKARDLAEFYSRGVWGFGPTVHAGEGTPWPGHLFKVGAGAVWWDGAAGESPSRLQMPRPSPRFCFPQGATVLFLNATDMDRSREYGQESIIYSLEGSSHFRINARSGEPPYALSLFSFQFPLLNFPWFSSPPFFLFHPHSFPRPSLLSPEQPA